MIINKKLLLTLGAGLIAASYASSSLAVEPCKMYLKVEAGYGFGSPKQKYSANSSNTGSANLLGVITGAAGTGAATSATLPISRTASKQLKGFIGDIGFGYNMTDAIRGDVAFGYSRLQNKTKNSTTAPNEPFYIDVQSMNLMASAYYDFNNSTDFTPYAGLGLGIERTKMKLKFNSINAAAQQVSNATNGSTFANAVASPGFSGFLPYNYTTGVPDATKLTYASSMKGKNKTSFAYQGELGVGYKMSEGVYVTLAYKLKNMEKYKKFTATNDSFIYAAIPALAAGAAVSTVVSNTAGYGAVTNIQTTKRTWIHSLNLGLRVEF